MLVIGSTALKRHDPEFPREPGDLDLIGTLEERKWFLDKFGYLIDSVIPKRDLKIILKMKNKQYIEIESDPSSIMFMRAEKTVHLMDFPELSAGLQIPVAHPSTLFLIKKSHADYAHYFRKTMHDYHWLKEKCPSKHLISAEQLSAYEVRRKEVAARVKKPKVNLKEPNEKFFTQYSINRDFEHDDVHNAVKYYDEPMYRKIKRDQSQAWCEWDLFDQLPYEDQLRTVREEAFVIALERYIFQGISRGRPPMPERAFLKAMEAICTRLWTGAWAWFAIDNYPAIVSHDVDYVEKADHLIQNVLEKRNERERAASRNR